ncbi:MAG TPA: PLP-dependent aminotransferase family protein [Solirubrobacterales bacterium]|nr:PLP-dependent aminotransferase family protein [Solirubrobacterales bacterium]
MAPSSGPVGSALLIALDRESDLPLHEQIERAIRDGIREGTLAAGTRLPSTRGLAAELGVSRGVVSEAYGQLAAEGYLLTRQGAPVQVARTVRPVRPSEPAESLLPSYRYHFHPGLPDLAAFPRDRWLRSLRAAWSRAPLDAVGYPDPRGVPALRQTLAGHLGRVRGVAADPEQLLICSGFSQAFSLLCRWLAERGTERVALEDPGWHRHRLIVEQAGLEVVPVPVDEEGLRVEALEETGADVALVTPAHQFPTGRVLSSERRAALVDWAERGERLIVEDDYDSEYRYDRTAIGALQGLSPERVVYIGSASKRLTPGMRVGWMQMPTWLAWPLIQTKTIEDGGSEVIGQLALQDFIERGELDRHLRRTRLLYERRREALAEALAEHLPDARLGEGAAGLYETVTLPAGVEEAPVIAAAAEREVGVEGFSLHSFTAPAAPALVLGFACLPDAAINRGVRLLAEAVEAA